jgi:hypothetical protein
MCQAEGGDANPCRKVFLDFLREDPIQFSTKSRPAATPKLQLNPNSYKGNSILQFREFH